MQALFNPAMSMMNHLSYSKKFVVLGCMSILAFMIVACSLYQNLNQVAIESQRELDGLAKINVFIQAVQALQRHRDLSSGQISGNVNQHKELKNQEQTTTKALAALNNILIPSSNNSSTALLSNIQSDWLKLQQNSSQYDLAANYAAHTELIAQLLAINTHLCDPALLSLESNLDTYYLMILLSDKLPRVLENIAQLRAYAVGALTQKQVSQEQIVHLLFLKATIEQTLADLDNIIANVIRYNPNLTPVLQASQQTIHSSTNFINQHAVSDIVQQKFMPDPEYFVSAVTLAINSVYLQIYENFLPATENLFKNRITQAKIAQLTNIGIPSALYLLFVYFAIATQLSITRSISTLAHAAKAFSKGDLQQRLPLTHQDEFGAAAASFNAMADEFNTLLDEQKQDDIRLQSIINTALDAVVQMDAQGKLFGWNHQAEHIFGWRLTEIQGQKLHEIIIPERFREAHQHGFQKFLADGSSTILNQRIEISALHKNGYEFPIELTITPNKIRDTVEFNAFIRDISVQKYALETLQHSEQNFRALFEYSSDALMTLSPNRGFISANPAAIKLFACKDLEEFLLQNPALFSPEYQNDGNSSSEFAQQKMSEAIETGSAAFEWLHQRMNGEIFSAEVQLSRLEIGQEIVLQAMVRDITERKQARAALIASEGRIRAVLRTMSDAVVLIDTFGTMLLINDALTNMFGFDEDELIHQNVKMLMPEPHFSAHDGYLKQHRDTKDRNIVGRRIEVQGKRKDGGLIPVELSVNELVDDHGSTFIGILRDISNRKATEEAHKTARLEAERLAHAKSEFLANMSHEIRTPLNAIIGLAKMTIRDNQGRSSQVNCSRIYDAGMHLLSLVNDILDFSKIEAGKMSLDLHSFRLSTLIEDCLSLVEMRAQEKNLNLIAERTQDLPDWVMGDSLRLRQIIVNLLSNAVKFTERGFVRLNISHTANEMIHFSVTDSGIGISEEQISRLFTAFEQADTSTTRKFGGSGLGLAISRNLAIQMGGDITVKSAAGVGSQFTLSVPLPITEAGIDHQSISNDTSQRLHGFKILAAEDVALNRMVLEDMLIYEGAQVVLAENGQQAIDILEKTGYYEFDVILMDIQMPIKDGYQTTKHILQIAPNIPVIGLTAHAMPEERKRCLEVGMRERITKPIDNNVLVAAILRHGPSKFVLQNVEETSVQPALEPASQITAASEKTSSTNEAHTPTTSTSLIDWDAMQQRFDGRQDFIDKLISNFLDGTHHENVNKLRLAVEQQDTNTLKFIAHSIKGLAGVFESKALLDLAQDTEIATKDQSTNTYELGMQLADYLQRLLIELQEYQDKNK